MKTLGKLTKESLLSEVLEMQKVSIHFDIFGFYHLPCECEMMEDEFLPKTMIKKKRELIEKNEFFFQLFATDFNEWIGFLKK